MRFILLSALILFVTQNCLAQPKISPRELLPLCFAKLVKLEQSERLDEAHAYLQKKAPSVLFDARVQALCMEIFNPKGEKERIDKARQALTEAGGKSLLEDEEFARAFHRFAFDAKMFDKLNVHNTEARKYFECLRMANNTKACLRIRKDIEAALEMYNLDLMHYPQAKEAKGLIAELHQKGYLRKPIKAQCPDGVGFQVQVDKSGYPLLRCPRHGTSASVLNPKFPLSPPEFKMMEVSNVVIASQIELATKKR